MPLSQADLQHEGAKLVDQDRERLEPLLFATPQQVRGSASGNSIFFVALLSCRGGGRVVALVLFG